MYKLLSVNAASRACGPHGEDKPGVRSFVGGYKLGFACLRSFSLTPSTQCDVLTGGGAATPSSARAPPPDTARQQLPGQVE